MIVQTMTASCGATIRIHDDCMIERGSEAEQTAIEAQRRAAYEILKGGAKDESDD